MAGVEQVDFGIRKIALERLRTMSDEQIVTPPDHPRRSLCHGTIVAYEYEPT